MSPLVLALAPGCMRGGSGGAGSVAAGASATAPPPAVVSVAPATGPIGGGTLVTVSGTGFATGAAVTVGGATAASVTVAGATQLTAVTPPGTAGAADVVVTNPDGQSGTLTGGFTYAIIAVESMTDSGAEPDVAMGGAGVAHVVWRSTTSSGRTDIWHARSLDGGATWSASPTNLSSSTDGSARPRVAARGSDVFVVWNETVSGVRHVQAAYSTDGGASFSTAASLRNNGTLAPDPTVAFDGTASVVVAYRVAGTSGAVGIDATVGTIGGSFGSPVSIEAGSADAAGAPAVAGDGAGTLVVAYGTATATATWRYPDIRVSRSTNGGATWSTPAVLVNSAAAARGPTAMAWRGTDVLIAFQQIHYLSQHTVYSAYALVSGDRGATWSGLTMLRGLLGGGPLNGLVYAPAAAIDGTGAMHVAWEEYYPPVGNWEIGGTTSTNSGQTWAAAANRSTTSGASRTPRLAGSAVGALTVFADDTASPGVFDVLVR